jgi:glycosyltransferase involved in cell wall biosynthesis
VAGNDHLAAYASRYNDRVFVVPSTVSLREYQPRPIPSADRIPVVGWTGSHSSVAYLAVVREALQELRKRRPFRLLVIGVEHFEIPGVEVECRPWSAATEVRDLWDVDVGIMPLPDEPWARGKCGMKAIQYMGIGIPAVVSPVGANREIVQDGVTGFHAATRAEWVERLDLVLGDAELRRRLGGAARESVRALYSAEAQAPRVAEILRQVVS